MEEEPDMRTDLTTGELIAEILEASDHFDSVMNGVVGRLEPHERQALWRVHEAMMSAAEALSNTDPEYRKIMRAADRVLAQKMIGLIEAK
jgi:hypothetical protein